MKCVSLIILYTFFDGKFKLMLRNWRKTNIQNKYYVYTHLQNIGSKEKWKKKRGARERYDGIKSFKCTPENYFQVYLTKVVCIRINIYYLPIKRYVFWNLQSRINE